MAGRSLLRREKLEQELDDEPGYDLVYQLTALGRRQMVTATSKWIRFVQALVRILAPEG